MLPAKRKSEQPMDGDLTMRQAVAARLQAKVGMQVSWKFGHASFQTADGKVFCFINREGNLAMKLPVGRIETLLESGDAEPLRMGKRTMREWVVVPEPESSVSLKLLREAKKFVESLPAAKPRRKAPAKKGGCRTLTCREQDRVRNRRGLPA